MYTVESTRSLLTDKDIQLEHKIAFRHTMGMPLSRKEETRRTTTFEISAAGVKDPSRTIKTDAGTWLLGRIAKTSLSIIFEGSFLLSDLYKATLPRWLFVVEAYVISASWLLWD